MGFLPAVNSTSFSILAKCAGFGCRWRLWQGKQVHHTIHECQETGFVLGDLKPGDVSDVINPPVLVTSNINWFDHQQSKPGDGSEAQFAWGGMFEGISVGV